MSTTALFPRLNISIDSVRTCFWRTFVAVPAALMAESTVGVPSEPTEPSQKLTPSQEATSRGTSNPSIWWQVAVYGTLLASMVANRYLRFANGGTPTSFFTTAFLLQDVIAALTAFPLVYAKLQQKTDQPIFAQLGVIFTAGMGWQHLVYSMSPR